MKGGENGKYPRCVPADTLERINNENQDNTTLQNVRLDLMPYRQM
ncbi:hypothetical protein [Conchiformibius steedae]|nr:hypothetical protein [Conchiformibius steedae]